MSYSGLQVRKREWLSKIVGNMSIFCGYDGFLICPRRDQQKGKVRMRLPDFPQKFNPGFLRHIPVANNQTDLARFFLEKPKSVGTVRACVNVLKSNFAQHRFDCRSNIAVIFHQ